VATIYEVAERAGVSASTVSRVLSGTRAVNPELAERVQKAARDLGFRPNRAARNLRLQRSAIVALVIPDIENPFFTSLARGVEDVAQEAGYNVILCNTDEDPAKEASYLEVIEADRMAGAIVASTSSSDASAKLFAAGTPLVAVDRVITGADVDTVLVDNTDSARKATHRLLSAGHRRIGCITGPTDVPSLAQRVTGFREAIAATRGARAIMAERPALHIGDGVDAMVELLAVKQRPDAVFAVNNTLALGAVQALRAAGVKPGEFGFASFGLAPWTEAVGWPMVTVEQPTRELGRTAATMLLERMSGDTQPARCVVLPTHVIDAT
jgi:LacI family transcriptional regulator